MGCKHNLQNKKLRQLPNYNSNEPNGSFYTVNDKEDLTNNKMHWLAVIKYTHPLIMCLDLCTCYMTQHFVKLTCSFTFVARRLEGYFNPSVGGVVCMLALLAAVGQPHLD